jgi:hypothetical protein
MADPDVWNAVSADVAPFFTLFPLIVTLAVSAFVLGRRWKRQVNADRLANVVLNGA